jgi:hypothetical protein
MGWFGRQNHGFAKLSAFQHRIMGDEFGLSKTHQTCKRGFGKNRHAGFGHVGHPEPRSHKLGMAVKRGWGEIGVPREGGGEEIGVLREGGEGGEGEIGVLRKNTAFQHKDVAKLYFWTLDCWLEIRKPGIGKIVIIARLHLDAVLALYLCHDLRPAARLGHNYPRLLGQFSRCAIVKLLTGPRISDRAILIMQVIVNLHPVLFPMQGH